MVAAIIRGAGRINIPNGQTVLFPGDRLEVLGDDNGLNALAQRINAEVAELTPNDQHHRLVLERFRVSKTSPLAGRTLHSSGIRTDFQCMAVGFESKEGESDTLELAISDRPILIGDVIWVVGEEEHIRTLLKSIQ